MHSQKYVSRMNEVREELFIYTDIPNMIVLP